MDSSVDELVVCDSESSPASDLEGQSSSSDEDEESGPASTDQLGAFPEARRAAVSRARSVSRSSKSKGKSRRISGGPSTKLKRVSPFERIKDFKGEYLTTSVGKLYCDACHVALSTKKSIVKTHVQSDRHKQAKEKLRKARAHQATLDASWKKYQQEHESTLPGTGLSRATPDAEIMRRTHVVEAFLKAGVPLAKIDYLRPLLESGNLRLTHSSHLAQLIPFISSMELQRVKEEIAEAQHVSVIFDGSTHLGEALAIILRFVGDDFVVKQRLIRVRVLAKSLSGKELTRELVACLSTTFQLPPDKVIAASRDGAAVNGAALRYMTVFYPSVFDVICFSHSLDNVGERFNTPTLAEFTQWWIALFARSPAARLAWRAQTSTSVKSFSATRWWSIFEVQDQMLNHFGDILPFLSECEYSPAARQRLLDIMENRYAEYSHDQLKVELAVVIDAGKIFVEKTYILEGDGLLVFDAYKHLQEVATAAADRYYPNVDAIIKQLAPNDQQRQEVLRQHAKECVQPAIDYFLKRFSHVDGDLYPVVRAFKAAQLCCPRYINETKPTPSAVDQLRVFPVFDNDEMIEMLKEELAAYKVATENVSPDQDRTEWWRLREGLPTWKKAAKIMMAIAPSSAAAERVFSLMSDSFGAQQERVLEDQLEVALMLQFNRGRSSLAEQ